MVMDIATGTLGYRTLSYRNLWLPYPGGLALLGARAEMVQRHVRAHHRLARACNRLSTVSYRTYPQGSITLLKTMF